MSTNLKCKFTRLSGGGALRSDTVEGICAERPVVGKCFEMLAEPLDPAMDARLVNTSLVKKLDRIAPDGTELPGTEKYVVLTRSGSLYGIEIRP